MSYINIEISININEYLNQKKEVYQKFLLFIESEDEEDYCDCYHKIKELIFFQDNENHDEVISMLRLILKISNNYHRTPLFDKKIEQTLLFIFREIKQTLSNFEIFEIFKNNKRILLFLMHNKFIIVDQFVLTFILSNQSYCHFFYPEIKSQMSTEERRIEEEKLLSIDQNIFDNFDEKRQIGENHSYICSLIREDSVEEFIKHVNRMNISISSQIRGSLFETNSFLLKNTPTLIEYSAFFGSIQIFKYLQLNGVQLPESLWLYTIHSKNALLIHHLNECNVEPNDKTYEEVYIEAIKCHHNDIANYIQDNLLQKHVLFDQNNELKVNEKVTENVLRYFNYFYFKENYNQKNDFMYLFKYKYFKFVNFLLENTRKEIEPRIISTSNFFQRISILLL